MLIRLLKVILFIPFMVSIVFYAFLTPVWYIIYNLNIDDVATKVLNWIDSYDKWH